MKRKGSVTPFRNKFRAYVGREYLGIFDTEQEGWDACEAWNDVEGDRAPDTLRVYGTQWLIEREKTVRGIKEERSRWDNHIKTAKFADWAMRRIQPKDINVWIRKLMDKRATQITREGEKGHKRAKAGRAVSRGTVVHCRNLLSLCFDAAVRDGKIKTNPCLHVRVPRVDEVVEDDQAWAYLTPEEIARLFAAIETEKKPKRRDFYRALYAVAIYGGLRKGEVLGLRWENITLDGPNPELRVRFSYNGPPKTKVSRRTVPLLAPLRAALDRWRRSGGVVRATGLVFPNKKASVFGKSYDAAWEKRWRGAAGIRSHVRFHDLRHTCASHLIMGTWIEALKPTEVMPWMGHSDLKTTMRYAHLAPDWLHSKVRTSYEQQRGTDRMDKSES
jgi:integrase